MATLPAQSAISTAIDARRTFAIISHPDAGKTTLTEKLLLYGNAIHLAGSVRARRNQRNTRSDWMSIERERGISISSTVLQFPYRDCVINLLDTPGEVNGVAVKQQFFCERGFARIWVGDDRKGAPRVDGGGDG